MTFNDVTILQFQRLTAAYKLRHDNLFEMGMDVLEVFEGAERSKLIKLSVNEFNKRLGKYAFLNDELPSDNWVKSFELDGVKYDVMQTPDKWNVGQFVSMANLTKDPDEIINNCHVIVAVMVSKDEDVRELSRLFQDKLSIAIAYPLALFFCAVMLKLPSDISHSLRAGAYPVGSPISGDGTM